MLLLSLLCSSPCVSGVDGSGGVSQAAALCREEEDGHARGPHSTGSLQGVRRAVGGNRKQLQVKGNKPHVQ